MSSKRKHTPPAAVAVVIWWFKCGWSWQAYTHLAVTTPWGVKLNLRKIRAGTPGVR
jgi:hypothetical protein